MITPPSRGIAIAVICMVLLAGYVTLCVRMYLASAISDEANMGELRRAARLEPWNAEYRHRLGRYYFYAVQDTSRALQEFQEAARLNPHSARLWLDLADLYFLAGNKTQVNQALDHALDADPTTPSVIWEVANTYFAEGDQQSGLRELKLLADKDPNSADRVVAQAWRLTHDEQAIVNDVLPPRPEPLLSFIQLLTAQNEQPSAAEVWTHLISLKQPFPARLAFPYVQFLIDQGDSVQAKRVWQDLATVDSSFPGYMPSSNLVVNSSFENPILNAGLDWRYQPFPDVTVHLDSSEVHSGNKGLAFTFNGALSELGIAQYVPVSPGKEYELTSFYKTQDLEGAGGVQWAAIDPATNTIIALTDPLSKADGWQEAKVTFKTGPETSLILLRLLRLPAGNILRGKLWIDDVALNQK